MTSETKFKETEIGMIPEEWKLLTLEKAMELIIDYRGKTPKKTDYGIPLITAKIVKNGRILEPNEFISPEDYESWMRRGLPKPGDVVITTEAPMGEVAQLDERKVALAQRLITLRGKNGILHNNFLRFVLQSPNVENELKKRESGTTVTGIKQKELRKVRLPIPPYGEQIKISEILMSLDDKIELNNQVNKTLEQIAQTLFKHWFIDFEFPDENGNPYKSSGGRMVDSELGEIPEGWEVKKIGNYLNTISKTYPLNTVSEVIFLNTGDIQNGRFLHSNKSTVETLPGQAKKSIQKDDILYSEIRPENKRFAYVFFDGKEYVVSTKLMVLRPIADIDSKFLYFILTQQDIIDFLQTMAESRSGTFPQITFNVLSQVEFCGPKDNKIIHMFSKSILAPFMQERYLKDEENIRLSNIRDSLLPKLMSGKIRVEC